MYLGYSGQAGANSVTGQSLEWFSGNTGGVENANAVKCSKKKVCSGWRKVGADKQWFFDNFVW